MTAKELRELDAWIAEHVMGWQWWRFGIREGANTSMSKWCQLVPPGEKWPVTKKAWHGVLCKCAIAGMEDCTDLSMFKPSTNAAAAMEVLKKCAETTDQISIVECVGTWAICEGDGNHRRPVVEGEAETLELAICLFAKKLCGGAT